MPCPANCRHAITCEIRKPTPSNAVRSKYFAYSPCKELLSFLRANSSVTLLSRINAVLAKRIRGIARGTQSLAVPERTMYALLSDVNIIVTDARPTHIPIR